MVLVVTASTERDVAMATTQRILGGTAGPYSTLSEARDKQHLMDVTARKECKCVPE